MLIGIRFFAKRGLNKLWDAIERDIRTYYSPKLTPLYVIQETGKEYLSIIFDIKDLDAFQDFLNSNPTIQTAITRTRSIPLHLPYYFELPDDHPKKLQRFTIFLEVDPTHYKSVHDVVSTLKKDKEVHPTFFCYSFGNNDVILSVLGKNTTTVRNFVKKKIDSIKGVRGSSISRIVRSRLLISKRRWDQHRRIFSYKERDLNPGRNRYERERAPMSVIVRLFVSGELQELWESVGMIIPKFESVDFLPLYASQQEASDYVSLVAEIRNFETINELFFQGLPELINVRQWRTFPLLRPMYFLMPKDVPDDLERYLISLKVNPSRYKDVYTKILRLQSHKDVCLTYLSYSLGKDDILMSILTENRKRAENFADRKLLSIAGVLSYGVSNQLRTMRLTSEKKWLAYRNKHLSGFDKEHRDLMDKGYDWTKSEVYPADVTIPFVRGLQQED